MPLPECEYGDCKQQQGRDEPACHAIGPHRYTRLAVAGTLYQFEQGGQRTVGCQLADTQHHRLRDIDRSAR
ncbi:hypothetical protein D3C81_1654870 [compost metagenome]